MEADSKLNGLALALELHRGDLFRFLVARSGDRAVAEELLNDLWLKVQASNAGPIDNARAYLFRMANNLVLDRVRSQRRRQQRDRQWTDERHGFVEPGHEPADDHDDAEVQLLRREEVRQLRDAIAKLPPGAQRVLRLHKLDELDHQQVATRLGISKSAVEKHMAVAMTHLRRRLADCGDD